MKADAPGSLTFQISRSRKSIGLCQIFPVETRLIVSIKLIEIHVF